MVGNFSFWLIFTAFSLFVMQFIGYCKTALDLRTGKIPYKLANFPSHIASQDAYERVLEKVSVFLDTIELGAKAEMILTQDDINTLYIEENHISLTSTKAYLFYELKDDGIIEKMLLLPSISIRGYEYREKKIQFLPVEGQLREKSSILNEYFLKNNESTLPIWYSPLLVFILGGSRNPAFWGYSEFKGRECKRALNAIKKLKSINIQKGYLILKT